MFVISFVRSVSMDKWKDLETEKMKVGGNRRALEFFMSQPDFYNGMSLQEKYNSRAAALYRDKVSFRNIPLCFCFVYKVIELHLYVLQNHLFHCILLQGTFICVII